MLTHTRINARAVITKDEKVLVCQLAGKTYHFLPGGGVEFTEGVEAALKRELKEELGVNMLSSTFIGGVENLFDNDGSPYHELNLLFHSTIDNHSAQSKEVGHVAFTWMPIDKLTTEDLRPKELFAALVQWLKDGKTFWVPMGKE